MGCAKNEASYGLCEKKAWCEVRDGRDARDGTMTKIPPIKRHAAVTRIFQSFYPFPLSRVTEFMNEP